MTRSPRFVDRSGVEALLRECRNRYGERAKRDWFLFYFLSRTGLRITEALAVKVGDCFPESDPPFVRVRTLKQRGRGPAWDDVLLEPTTAKHVRRWIDDWPRGPFREPGRKLIPPMTRRNASKLFRFYARRAGLPRTVTLHSLRHYRGSTLYERTRDLEFTREQMRHRGMESTKVYIHHTPDQVRRYLEDLES